jgi:hypothetical protein
MFPPGDHWAEAHWIKAMNITASTIAVYFADDISIIPPIELIKESK